MGLYTHIEYIRFHSFVNVTLVMYGFPQIYIIQWLLIQMLID